MMIPRFIRFYNGYTTEAVLQEYGLRFFSLLNAMFRIQADEAIDLIEANNPTEETVKDLQKRSKGISGLAEEVRIAKRFRNG